MDILELKLDIVSPVESYTIKTRKRALAADDLERGDCVELDANGEIVKVGATVNEVYSAIIWDGAQDSPGVGSEVVSVIEPHGQIEILTMKYDGAQTYALNDKLVMKDGVFTLYTAGTDPVWQGYVEEVPVGNGPLKVRWFFPHG